MSSIDTEIDIRKFAAEGSPEDRLNESAFTQSLMKEDISQRLEDIRTMAARSRMQQRNIQNLQERMYSMKVVKEILKNEKTRKDDAVRSFIGTWFQKRKE